MVEKFADLIGCCVGAWPLTFGVCGVQVKTPESLFKLYLQSVGRGANLLLNVPPDERGLINENDAASALAFKHLLQKNFSINIFKNASGYYLQRGILKKLIALSDGNKNSTQLMEGIENYSAGINIKTNKKVNCIVLKEQLNNGQHCAQFKLMLFNKADQLVKIIDGTTIGRKRILTFPAVDINTIELTILQQDGVTAVSEIEAYLMDESLVEKK